MSLAIHPFITGQPFRLKYLDKILGAVAATKDVWLATSDEIADYYLVHHYETARESIERKRKGARTQ